MLLQVQCKFLVGLLDGAVLVAIDQHAAGERVKLEEIEDATSRLPHPSVVSFKLSTPTRIEVFPLPMLISHPHSCRNRKTYMNCPPASRPRGLFTQRNSIGSKHILEVYLQLVLASVCGIQSNRIYKSYESIYE